jgi:hypothetical protein
LFLSSEDFEKVGKGSSSVPKEILFGLANYCFQVQSGFELPVQDMAQNLWLQ